MATLPGIDIWNARDYARNSAPQFQWAKELMAKIPLSGGETLCDIGCGDGKITVELAQQLAESGGSVVGVDASDDMVRYASQQYPRSIYPNLDFVCCDARKLSLNRKFDVVFSNAALHWIDDHCSVLRGIYTHTTPNALVLMQMGGQGNAADFFDVVQQQCALPDWQRYFKDFTTAYYFYGTEDYQRWLEEAGFSIERLALIPKTMAFEDLSGLAGWIRTTGMPFTSRVPEDKRETFIVELVQAYTARKGNRINGAINLDMVRLEVQARRISKSSI